MKKNRIIAVFAGVLVLCALSVAWADAEPERELSETVLANIDALTNDEAPEDLVVKCFCKTKWFSPNICSANADGAYCGGDPCANHDSNCR